MVIPLLTGLLCLPAPRPADGLLERGGRPELSGVEQVLDHGAFRLHYTATGGDAVPPDDLDGNGQPDLVDRVAAALDLGEQAYLDAGYRALVPDGGEGGSEALDLYLRVLPVNGYAYPVAVQDGYSCFMEIDPGLTSPGQILESVVVHELHHCVQYRYTVQALSWIYEATATYEQYAQVQSTTLQAALDVLWNERLRGADLPLAATDGRFEYAGFALLKFLTDRSGEAGEVERLWSQLAEQPDWQPALDAFDGDWRELALDFHTWNAFACSRDDGQHYDSASHPCTFPASSVNTEPLAGDELRFEHAASPGSALYIEAASDAGQVPRLDCTEAVDGAESVVRLVGVDAAGASGEEVTFDVPGAGGLTAPLAAFVAIGASFGAAPSDIRCAVSWAEAEEPTPEPPAPEDEGEGCACSAGAGGSLAPLLFLLVALRAARRSSTGACAC